MVDWKSNKSGTAKTPTQKAEEILEFFAPRFRKSINGDHFTEPRVETSWGTKTREGVKASLIRIITDD